MEVELTEVDSSTPKRKFVLDKLPVMIGQDPEAAIRLDDHWVSRRHCQIDAVRGTLVVRDLGSMLGTFVNGLNVSTAQLMPGDKLTVGATSFLVDYQRSAKPRPARRPDTRPVVAESSEPSREKTHRGFPRLVSRLFHLHSFGFRRKRSARS